MAPTTARITVEEVVVPTRFARRACDPDIVASRMESATSLTTALPACQADERVGRAGRKTPLVRADDVFARKLAMR